MKKNLFKLLGVFSLVLSLCFVSLMITNQANAAMAGPALYPNSKVPVGIGDILVSNSTSSAGIVGHAGIVTSHFTVASIAGYGYHPEEISISKWFKKYPNEKVIRYSDSDAAADAAEWATTYVKDHPDATYGLANKLKGMNETYCAKIVWQAYYYGADVNFDNMRPNSTALFTPYQFLSLDNTTLVLKVGKW